MYCVLKQSRPEIYHIYALVYFIFLIGYFLIWIRILQYLIALHYWVRQLYIVRWRFQVTVSGIASLSRPLYIQCNEQILSSRSDRNRNAKCTHKLMIYFIIITLVSVYMYHFYSVSLWEGRGLLLYIWQYCCRN